MTPEYLDLIRIEAMLLQFPFIATTLLYTFFCFFIGSRIQKFHDSFYDTANDK